MAAFLRYLASLWEEWFPPQYKSLLSLDGSGHVIAEWSAYAHSTTDAIKLTEGLDWQDGAVRMRLRRRGFR